MKETITNNMVIHDIESILLGKYILTGFFIVMTVLILGMFAWCLVNLLKKNKDKEMFSLSNTITLGLIGIFAVAFTTFQIQGNIVPMKETIAKENWKIVEDVCLDKSAGATPNVEAFELKYREGGKKRVSEDVYRKAEVGSTDYIVQLPGGDEIIYSGAVYTKSPRLKMN